MFFQSNMIVWRRANRANHINLYLILVQSKITGEGVCLDLDGQKLYLLVKTLCFISFSSLPSPDLTNVGEGGREVTNCPLQLHITPPYSLSHALRAIQSLI